MDTYDQSEREQIEAIKKWWKENGSSLIIGVILGLGIIFGWRGWQSYIQQQADVASATYERMLLAFGQNYDGQGRNEASVLMSDYNKTTYASLAALYLAKQELEAGNVEASHVNLKWVIEQNVMPELTQIARLRQARLYLAENKMTEAKNMLSGEQGEQFKAAFAELKGDIAVLENDFDTARQVYQTALDSDTLASAHRTLLQMKLDDLGAKAPEFIFSQKPKSALGSPSTLQDSMIVVDKPIVTTVAPSVQPMSPTDTPAVATPSTQEDTSLPVTETGADTQSAVEMKSIAPLTPILQHDIHIAMPDVVQIPDMQLATVPNLMPHQPITITPRELQDKPATLPTNTWYISTQATLPIVVPTTKLQPAVLQDQNLKTPTYSTTIEETIAKPQDKPTLLLQVEQAVTELPVFTTVESTTATMSHKELENQVTPYDLTLLTPQFSSMNQSMILVAVNNKALAIAPMTAQDTMLTQPLYSEQI